MITIAKALLGSKLFWGAALSAGALVWGYNWAVDYGDQRATVKYGEQIILLNKTITGLKERVSALETLNDQREAAYKTSLLYLHNAHQETMDSLKRQLNVSEARRRKLEKDLEKEARRLVSPKADGACVVPAGFVSLHDQTIKTDQSASPEASAFPGGGQEDVDAPSGIPLSEVGRTVSLNYQECVDRGDRLRAWQSWYTSTKAAWDAANQVQEELPSN